MSNQSTKPSNKGAKVSGTKFYNANFGITGENNLRYVLQNGGLIYETTAKQLVAKFLVCNLGLMPWYLKKKFCRE